jgi:hypothetical protein
MAHTGESSIGHRNRSCDMEDLGVKSYGPEVAFGSIPATHPSG